MLVACMGAKGGSGTTVIASGLALVAAQNDPAGDVLLVDLAGDVPAVLGLDGAGPGVAEWARAADRIEPEVVDALAVPAAPRLRVLPQGSRFDAAVGGHDHPALARAMVEAWAGAADLVIVDLGTLAGPDTGRSPHPLVDATLERADGRLLVTRPCYVALARAISLAASPTSIVLVSEPGRALGPSDAELALGCPVSAVVHYDPVVARAVDAGLLVGRLPRRLSRPLAGVLAEVGAVAA